MTSLVLPYVFLFGRTPLLARAELAALHPGTPLSDIVPGVVATEGLDLDPYKEIERLGGTVKIAVLLKKAPECTKELMAEAIASQVPAESFTFGISTVGDFELDKSFLREVKEQLSVSKKHVRFVEPREGTILSSAVVKGQQVEEFLVIKTEREYVVCLVIAVQNIDEWSKRDYARPHADAKRGMLPPKVARMVVNIALGEQQHGKKLLDPFCGMGTIVAESYLTGNESFGADLDETVVLNAKENLSWLKREYPAVAIPPKFQVMDAVHISTAFPANFFDAIVTEPFLGSPKLAKKEHLDTETVKNTIRGLEKLYIGCLKDWDKILKPQGYVVMALPAFMVEGHKHFVKKVVDSCENFGYSIKQGPLEYSRPQAVVSREFYIFQKK